MLSEDAEYYRARAIAERELAKSAAQQNVAAIHEELARQFEALVDQPELRPTLQIERRSIHSSWLELTDEHKR